ncbi:MAG: Lrp/AsnC family transcriptional regulator [Candidatus Bathyarchaeia archaeon]
MRRGKIDDLDLKIMSLLSENPRMSVKYIAEKAGSSRPTVTKRLKTLLESGLIAINVGLNLRSLGFRTAYVGLEIKSMARKKEILDVLTKCPRVLTVLQPSGEVNMNVYCYGENSTTLDSFIESLREVAYLERIVYVQHSEPPIHPENLCVKIHYEKRDVAPCGLICQECEDYKKERCLGCPAVKAYRGLA